METNEVVILPAEVEQIAQNVSAEKRSEVQAVLNSVFAGVAKMREQLETVVVKNPDDKVNMKLANTIRLGVRQVRLDAEKTFDAKRAEVQALMLSYKTEDQLWLKAKQTMQILTKEIEENARWKEETRARFDAEQRELKTQQRIVMVSKFAPEVGRHEFEHMTDETFESFLAGIEQRYNEKIEAERRAEEERVARERAEAEERERIRKENERLKAEREAQEKRIAEERAKAEAERKAAEDKLRKEREEFEKKAAAERAKQEAILKAEREAREMLEAEVRAKAESEAKAKRELEEKAAAELKAAMDAERKAKSAPDKAKLMNLAKTIDSIDLPEMSTDSGKKVISDVRTLLDKVCAFVRDKASSGI